MATITPEQVEFQEYASRWLEENRPPPPTFRMPITPLEVMYPEQIDSSCRIGRGRWEARLVGVCRGLSPRRKPHEG